MGKSVSCLVSKSIGEPVGLLLDIKVGRKVDR